MSNIAFYMKSILQYSGEMLVSLTTTHRRWPQKEDPPFHSPQEIECKNERELICGSKMPTRCNRGFYCRSYCLLNMFRAPLCPSSGAQEYYSVVAACSISCCGFQVACLVRSWGLCVRFAGCCSIVQTGHITLSSTPDQLLEKTTAQNNTRSNHGIILLSSWWWA